MRLIVDANVLISALVADSRTRELVVTLEPDLLAPSVVRDEIRNHEELVVEKSGMDPERVAQFIDLLFQYVDVVPVAGFHHRIEEAKAALGDVDPDDVLYLACALGADAAIWSDDSDFREQGLVDVYTTADVVEAFDDGLRD